MQDLHAVLQALEALPCMLSLQQLASSSTAVLSASCNRAPVSQEATSMHKDAQIYGQHNRASPCTAP